MTTTSDSSVESTYLSIPKSPDEKPATRATIACVIPAYNEEETIAEVLTSVLEQTRLPDVIHVVNNNSADETFFIARTLLVPTSRPAATPPRSPKSSSTTSG